MSGKSLQMNACHIGVLMAAVSAVFLWPSETNAREGWSFDFTTGAAIHVGFHDVHNEFPDGVSAPAEVGLLNELDIGYSWPKRFSFGFGLEFNNIIDVGYKLDFKWSFLENQQIQPYFYFCLHGGITDWTMAAIHPGLGLDIFVTQKVYFIIDGRIGYALESAEVPKDPETGDRNYDHHFEGAISFGIGVLFGRRAKMN